MNRRGPSAALAARIRASRSSGVAMVYRSGSGAWSRSIWTEPPKGGPRFTAGGDSLVARPRGCRPRSRICRRIPGRREANCTADRAPGPNRRIRRPRRGRRPSKRVEGAERPAEPGERTRRARRPRLPPPAGHGFDGGAGIGHTRTVLQRPATGTIPDTPGSYQFKDRDGRVIYVGKAHSLRQRLSSYFQSPAGLPPRTAQMVAAADSVEWIQVRNDVEALMLEYNLIKAHRPRFNVRLRDDKSYPFLAVTMDDEWPRAMVMRGQKRKGTRYFGPYG